MMQQQLQQQHRAVQKAVQLLLARTLQQRRG
jgi:hypothetical protein